MWVRVSKDEGEDEDEDEDECDESLYQARDVMYVHTLDLSTKFNSI